MACRCIFAGVLVVWMAMMHFVAPEPLFPAMFVFGDSLVDVGNNNYIFSLAKANFLPNGLDFPSGPTGRFSNGRNLVDILCAHIRLPLVPPFLAPTTTGSGILQGVNFASGAAGILNETGQDYIGRISLSEQVGYFRQTRKSIQRQLGRHNSSRHISKALFCIVIGSNDYINNYLLDHSSFRPIYKADEYHKFLVAHLESHIKALYKEGARKFSIAGLGVMGCIPSQMSKGNGTFCISATNQMAKGYNEYLKSRIMHLNSKLRGAKLIYLDAFNVQQDIVNNSEFGFNNTLWGCCGGGKLNGEIPCLPFMSQVCPDRLKHIFWDPFHPTEAVNLVAGYQFFNGGPKFVYPMNMKSLAMY